MKRKFINFLSVSSVLIAMLTIASCSDDNEPKPQPEPETSSLIVGEWFYDMSSSKLKGYSIEEYTNNGVINYTFMYCYPKAGYNEYHKYSGTYSLADKSLTTSISELGTNTNRISYIDEYTMVTDVASDGSQETFSKIVTTLNVKVNESVRFNFDDANFNGSVFYKSCDENIVKVDANGSISGVKRGTGYVVARSATGAVVARVIVTDPDRTIDEFDNLLDISKNDLYKTFDPNFILDLKTGSEYTYCPGDGEIYEIYFRFSGDKLISIMVGFWDASMVETATTFLKGKFKRYGVETDDFNAFSGENDYCKFIAYTNLETLSMGYEIQLNDFEKYDTHINDTADQYAAMFDYQLTAEDDGYCTFYIDGELYYGVSMMYDEESRGITSLSYTCQNGVTVEQMEEYVKAAYDSYYEGLGYYHSADLFTNPVFVKVTTSRKGATLVKYTKL